MIRLQHIKCAPQERSCVHHSEIKNRAPLACVTCDSPSRGQGVADHGVACEVTVRDSGSDSERKNAKDFVAKKQTNKVNESVENR